VTEGDDDFIGFADDHDNWGMKIDPDELKTLHCLSAHLSAELDYHKDPRKRPTFTFQAVDEQLSPNEFNLENILSSQDILPGDLQKLKGANIRTVGDLRKKGVGAMTKSLNLHSSMRFALTNILASIPEQAAWVRITGNRKSDPFRITLDKKRSGQIPPNWSEDEIHIEIEELEEKKERKGEDPRIFSFRIKVTNFDLDTSIMTLRPDQWDPKRAEKWARLLDRSLLGNKSSDLHFREAANAHNTIRKLQAVNLLIKGKTEQAKNLAYTIRDANRLPSYQISDNGKALLNPGLNLHSTMSELDRRGVETQRKSVINGLSFPDISLIRGPPGTGKTTVICEIIQQLAVEQGLRVLMVAPTHVAVDNVLERIGLVDGPNFLPGVYPLRHARGTKGVSSDLRMFTWDELSNGLRSRLARTLGRGMNKNQESDAISEIQQNWLTELRQPVKGRDDQGKERFDIIGHMLKHNVNLVCATTIGITTGGHFEAEDIPFDLLIIDEASKATLGEFLVPGVRAKRWLLVGDEKQLSPYVERDKIRFILSRVIWEHFTFDRKWKPIWVQPLTKPGSKENELVGYFAMNDDVQRMFEECAKDVGISLKQWFDHRMSNNENVRRSLQWNIYRSILNLRADLEDKWAEVVYDSQIKSRNKEIEKIDRDFSREIANWERKCKSTKKEHEMALEKYIERQAEIKIYPTILAKAEQDFQAVETAREKEHIRQITEYESLLEEWDSADKKTRGLKPKKPTAFETRKFTPPKKPNVLQNPGEYQQPKKPQKKAYPEQPHEPEPSWRRPPRNMPKIRQLFDEEKEALYNASWDWKNKKMVSLPKGKNPEPARNPHDAIRAWCFDPNNSDSLGQLWKNLVMVSDLEYNSGFELFEGWLSNNKQKNRIISLNTQHRMHPKIAEFNSQVVYGNEYYSSSYMSNRGFPTRLFGTPLQKDDSLVLLDTSLLGEEAIEVSIGTGKANVAEAKVVVEAIVDLARVLSSTPHPEGKYWEIGVISPYIAQAAVIRKALRISDIVQPFGHRFVDSETKSVRIEVNVVDRFQGREADVILLPLTRANNYGSLGFMTTLNRINVATSRARHRLILVGNAKMLKEMGKKHDARNVVEDDEGSMTENTAPQNFVSQLIDHVQKNGRSLQIYPKDLKIDWKGIDLVPSRENDRKRGGRK